MRYFVNIHIQRAGELLGWMDEEGDVFFLRGQIKTGEN
jgi:hypothetical protein